MDITNPVPKSGVANTGPKLLWQLTTDLAGNRLFGKRGATPAISTLFFATPGNAAQEYAVAILPGGDSDGPLAGSCTQLGTATLVDPARPPRPKVRCFANDPARSLTIVRLDTGEVIRSFRAAADGPASILPRSRDTLNVLTALNAPVSGQPVLFPATTGAVADRAFVGDRDGSLWRIDLSSTDPQKWTMKLFFDAYTGLAFDAGQPIATPPVLSVDRVGNVSIAFSTGDQETFLATTGMKNFVWSLLETTPTFRSVAQWSKVLIDGERVSGPMSLFSSTLYYTTFTPPSGAASQQCTNGQSKLCGVHYLLPAAGGDGGAVPVPSLNTATDPCLTFGDSIIFGAGITQKPTCSSETTYNDPYLGNTSHASLSNVNPGKFMLVVQTGPGGKTETGGDVHTRSIELAPPMASTRVDSWAAVVE
jgi:type IV pilus assembly protein PilY1